MRVEIGRVSCTTTVDNISMPQTLVSAFELGGLETL